MKRSYTPIILSYGLFLGWLLSFAYNGPVLIRLTSKFNVPVASYSLTYTAAPVTFLIVFAFFPAKEKYSKIIMKWCGIACILGTFYLFAVSPAYWYPILALMGIASVMYIVGWSYFYTSQIPVGQKLPVMALVIMTGNLIYYIVNILDNYIQIPLLLFVLQATLLAALWASVRISADKPFHAPLKNKPFPTRLILVTCLLLFLLNINDGLTFHTVYPSFDKLFPEYFTYYGIIPYLVTLAFLFMWGRKLSLMLPVFLGTSLLGLAYLSFGLLSSNWYSYFITETLLQSGWAIMDLVLWTVFGLVASVYGNPLRICSLAFLANLSGVFGGGLLHVRVLERFENAYLVAATFAVSVIFVSLVIIHWLNQVIEKDLRNNLLGNGTTPIASHLDTPQPASVQIPQREVLSTREKEIADLLIRGYTNKQIAEMLNISNNTLKSHAKNIYAKLNVANKRELLQLSYFSPGPQISNKA